MTDEAKALVKRLRWKCVDVMCVERDAHCAEAADLIETQAHEIERLRGAISSALRCTPQSKHGAIIYDCGDPWEILTAALAGDSHED